MKTITLRKYRLKELSKLAQIFGKDETRTPLYKTINFRFTPGKKLQVAATDGHCFVKYIIDDEQLYNELAIHKADSVLKGEESFSLSFKKAINCKANEEMEMTTIIIGDDIKINPASFPKYESIIPSKYGDDEHSLATIGFTLLATNTCQKLVNLFFLRNFYYSFTTELSPIVIKSNNWGTIEDDNMIILMPAKVTKVGE